MPANRLPKSLQEAFDIVWNRSKLLKKTTYSTNNDNTVHNVYRATDNHKGESCFIGELIPDSLYSKELEHRTISNIITYNEEFKVLNPIKNQLQELQEIHDLEPVNSWKEKLINFAKRHGLGIPE